MRKKIVMALALSGATCPALALAQGATGPAPQAAADDNQPGDIVVTANKREQRLSDVGLTVVAQSGAQLQTAGVSDVSDLAKVVPGFSTGTTVVGGYKVFSLRGINFNADMISAPPAVSVYVDEAALPYSAMTGGLLLDVERVEVLKGPQGTLFGQNATGGSINVIAAKPTSTLGAGLEAEVNHFGQVMLEGFVNIPLTPTLNARVSGMTTQFGAWQRGYYLSDRKNGDQNKGAARLLLDWHPTDRLKVSVNVNANYDRSQAIQFQFGGFAPTIPGNAFPGASSYPLPRDNRDADITPSIDTRVNSRMYQGVLRLDYEFSDAATLTSITNYADFKTRSLRDADATVFDISSYAPEGRIRTFNQEVRLSGKLANSVIDYILGANYQYDRILDVNTNNFPHYSALPPGAVLTTAANIRNRAAGVFGNVDVKLADRLTATGGVRYTETKQTYNGCLSGNDGGVAVLSSIANAFSPGAGASYVSGGCLTINDNVPGAGGQPDYRPIFGIREQKEHNVSWRAGLNFKPTRDTLIYGLVSRGYKAGLIPVQQNLLNSALKPISQEKLTSYEVGAKLAVLDNAVRFNLSGFYYQYVDKQFFTFRPAPVVGFVSDVVNIPKSSVKGVDLDVVITPTYGLTLRGAVTYIKTKVGAFKTFDSVGNILDTTGKEFNYAPPWSGSFDAEYKVDAGADNKAYIGGGGTFNDRTFSALGEAPSSRVPAYLTLDARIGIESAHGWHAGLFVRNLTNKYYYSATFFSGDAFARVPGLPRVFGANFGVKF